MKDRKDDDPQIKLTMPEFQVRTYNRLIALMNGVNHYLGPYVLLIKALVDLASTRVGWLMTVNLLAIRDEEGQSTTIVVELTKALIDHLRVGIACQWQEIRAIEMLAEEIAEEFEGDDPMMPELRSVFEEAKAGLSDIAGALGRFGIETDLPEPGEDVMNRVRLLVQRELDDRHLVL
jgi:hypothetical protein